MGDQYGHSVLFPSVSSDRVREVARELPIPEEDVELLVHLTTRKDHLPQGAPTSPVLGNLVLRDLDQKNDLVRGSDGIIRVMQMTSLFLASRNLAEFLKQPLR